MTRDELIQILHLEGYTLPDKIMLERRKIVAEFDRKDALIAQLLEACKAYIENPQSPMVYDMIEAAIRAAEEE